MANLSQERREKMLAFLETLKEKLSLSDDESLIALGEIERELKAKNVHYPNGNNERKKSSPLIKGVIRIIQSFINKLVINVNIS